MADASRGRARRGAAMGTANAFATPLLAWFDLRDDLLDRIAMTVFLDGREPLRSAASADARIAAHRAGIGLPLGEISRTVQLALERGRVGRQQANQAQLLALLLREGRAPVEPRDAQDGAAAGVDLDPGAVVAGQDLVRALSHAATLGPDGRPQVRCSNSASSSSV